LQGYELGPGAPIAWLPDEQNLVARAHEPGHTANRLVVYNIESGATKPITPELRLTSLPKFAVVRDGSAIFAQAKEEWFRFPISGGPAIPVKGVLPEEYILQCAADGKHVYAGHQMPAGGYRFLRVDPETGQREVLRDVPGQGLATGFDADISPDGATIAYTATTRRSTLYLLTGVR
jgi:hypothetical protein